MLLDVLGLPHLPLPSKYAMFEVPSACWTAWTEAERVAVSTEMSRAIIKSIRPNILVIDCFPQCSLITAALESKVAIVLCLREMKNLEEYFTNMRELVAQVKLILVPHEPNSLQLPQSLMRKSRFVGRIVRPIAIPHFIHRDPDRPRIVISGGGGGFPGTVEFYNFALEALSALRCEYPKCECRLIAGPLFEEWSRLNMAEGIRVIPFDPDSIGSFAEADLVICQAGYNTLAELEQLGTRAILVPAERGADDQFARANRLAKENLNFQTFDGADPCKLAHLILQFLKRPVSPLPCQPPVGAMTAAETLCALLRESSD